jgi:hypothetical protein
MYCLICVNSTTSATVYFTNQSTNVGTSFTITAPSGTTLAGNCAEWIVERPTAATTVTMTGGGGASLSVPTIENSHLMKVTWLRAS